MNILARIARTERPRSALTGRAALLVLIVVAGSRAQDAHLDLTLPRLGLRQVWTTDDGLPQNSITSIVQTPAGYLWLGTFGGLARFDGLRFEVFDVARTASIGSNRILALHLARDGALWIGTGGAGVTRYQNGRFEHLPPELGAPEGSVQAIAEADDGSIWFAGETLARYRRGVLERVAVQVSDSTPITCLYAEGRTLWAGTGGGELFRLGDAGTSVLRLAADGAVIDLLADGEGRLLAVTDDAVTTIGDGRIVERRERDRAVNLFGATRQRDGTLWLRRWQGVSTWSRESGEVPRDYVAFDCGVRSIHEDEEGHLWVGLNGRGLALLERMPFVRLTEGDGLPARQPVEVAGTGDQVWVAFSDGTIYALREARPPTRLDPPKGGLWRESWISLGGHEGGLWIGEGKVLTHYDGRDFEVTELAAGEIREIRPGPGPGALVLTSEALVQVEPGRSPSIFRIDPKEPDPAARAMATDAGGGVWIAARRGLYRFDGSEVMRVAPPPPGVAPVRSILAGAAGTLWIGTYGSGLVRYRAGRYASVTSAQGLPDDSVSSLLAAEDGTIWANTNRGLFAAAPQDLDAAADGARRLVCRTFATGEANGPSGYRDGAGRLWFPTVYGMSVTSPALASATVDPPPVVIEGVFADGEALPSPDRVTLFGGRGDVEFRFTALGLRDAGKTRFSYRLDGYDRDWIEAGGRRQATYTNIPAGSYTFRVRAANESGQWARTASVSLSFAAGLTERPWFRVLVIGLLLLGLFGLHRLSVRFIRARNEQLRREIDTRRRAEIALRRSTERYRVLSDTASDAIVTFDEDGRITHTNPATERIFGHDVEELIGQSIAALMSDSDEIRTLAGTGGDPTAGGSIRSLARAQVARTRSGEPLPVEVSLADFPMSDGRRYFTAVIRDVSDRVRVEEDRLRFREKLRESERLEAIGRLAGGVSHDFNNILTALMGYAQILQTEIGARLPLQSREHLDEILRCSERAATLTKQLLVFSRRQVLKPEDLQPNEVLASLQPLLQRLIREDIQLVFILSPTAGTTRVDRGQLEQVIMNLVLNARDAIRGVGRIEVETEAVTHGVDYVSRTVGARVGPHVRISVRDTGSGIPDDVVPRLFEPLFTTKPLGEGTGLGLSTVYGVVTQSGGHVTVDTEVGQGTTFHVLLPRGGVTKDLASSREKVRSRASGSATVLLCSEHASDRRAARTALESEGFRCIVAVGPQTALRLARGARPAVDVIVAEVAMSGVGRGSLVEELEDLPSCPPMVRVAEASADGARRRAPPADPGRPTLKRPFGAQQLVAAVRRALAEAVAPEGIDAEEGLRR